MSKFKVCVYAIAKNEEKFVKRWYDSIKDADEIYVLDTGSTDNTVSILKSLGVNVIEKEIVPWRFDIARNESLKLVPDDTDICICIDIDEIMSKGWREELESIWNNNINLLSYNYNWNHDEKGRPLVNFYIEKIHSRNDFEWVHPVHEVLKYNGNNLVKSTTDKITVDHYADNTKSRSSYLPLLELSVKENPTDDRNMHYLGREYMFYGKWNESIDTLIKHLSLESSTWKDERCASMRFIARCYKKLGRFDEAKMWLEKAIVEAPYLREPFVERAILAYEEENWDDVLDFSFKALEIKFHPKTYINESFCWDHTVYDLMSLAYFYKGNYFESLRYVNLALEMSPDNDRLINNKEIIMKYYNMK